MVLYLSIITLTAFLVSLFNILFNAQPGNYILFFILTPIFSVIFEFAIDGLFAYIIHLLPNKYFSSDKKIFKVEKSERKFYDKLKIKSWKDYVWELGGLGGFSKSKITNPNNPDYLKQFIYETNKGEITHIIGIFVGFLVIFILPLKYALVIGLPIALVNAFLNILPIFILRYNEPKLEIAYKRALQIKERENVKKIEVTTNDKALTTEKE